MNMDAMFVNVRLPSQKLCRIPVSCGSRILDLKQSLSTLISDDVDEEFYFLKNGSIKHSEDELFPDETIDLCRRLRGGKGGFGSMLRAIGAQIEKTTNREACRDLSGRRLRAINDEKRYRHYAKIKAEKEVEREEKRRKKLESMATSKPKHEFKDEQYFKDREQIPDMVEEAVATAFDRQTESTSEGKRPSDSAEKRPAKKIKGWMAELDEFEDSESDKGENEEEEEEESSSSSSSEKIEGVSDEKKSSDENSADPQEKDEQKTDQTPEAGEAACEESLKQDEPEVTPDQVSETSEESTPKSTASDTVEEPAVSTTDATAAAAKTTSTDATAAASTITTDAAASQEQPEAQKEEEIGEIAPPPAKKQKTKKQAEPIVISADYVPIDFSSVVSVEELLQKYTADELKAELFYRGVKCGGAPKERAERLWLVKDLSKEEIPSKLAAKK